MYLTECRVSHSALTHENNRFVRSGIFAGTEDTTPMRKGSCYLEKQFIDRLV